MGNGSCICFPCPPFFVLLFTIYCPILFIFLFLPLGNARKGRKLDSNTIVLDLNFLTMLGMWRCASLFINIELSYLFWFLNTLHVCLLVFLCEFVFLCA